MVSIGIDVSKGKSMVCILSVEKMLASPYEMQHTGAELQALIERIRSYPEECRVILESTGIYHMPVLLSLHEAGIFVCVVNPMLMKKYISSCSIRKAKTDRADAIRIAQYGLDHWFHLENYILTESIYEQLRLLDRQYEHYSNMKVASKQALDTLLSQTMPGLKPLLCSKKTSRPEQDKLSDFVERYWHYDLILKQSEKQFVSSYCTWAQKKGYRSSIAKAQEIYAAAQNGIPTLSSKTASTKMLVLEAVRVLKEINRTLSRILTQMQELATTLPEYSVVREMNGVGDVLAVRFIAEIGDIRRFHSGSSLVAYAGIDSPPYQSGAFSATRCKISKRGSPILRKIGFDAMKVLKSVKPTQDDAVYRYILKKETEGKPPKVAKIAGLNKFLRIYYARVSAVYAN